MLKKTLDKLYYIFEAIYHNISFFSKIYIKIHSSSVNKEIKMAKITQNDKILHIGCGAIPYTSLLINQLKNAKIIGLDNKKRIIQYANKYIKKYKLDTNTIKFEFADGKNYDVSNFDVIIISYGVPNQDKVLENVITNCKKNTRILLRRSTIKKNQCVDSIVEKYKKDSILSLLTQESILLKKN